MRLFEEILRCTQKELFSRICKVFKPKKLTIRSKKYILVKGDVPIMLVAHLDTVHKNPVKEICMSKDGNTLMSPEGIGGDDRCGVYALLSVYERAPKKPWLLFTCDEEVGGIGAKAFCADYEKNNLPKGLKHLRCIVEIDRKGRDDAVYYDCGNEAFEDYITSKGFKTNFGSYSDISDIAPTLGVAAVNLSSGYYNAHTQHEYIKLNEIHDTIDKVVEIVSDASKSDFPRYEYIESVTGYGWYGGGWSANEWGYLSGYSAAKSKKKGETDKSDAEKVEYDESDIESTIVYKELLDWYHKDELDWFIENYGEDVLYELYDEIMDYSDYAENR